MAQNANLLTGLRSSERRHVIAATRRTSAGHIIRQGFVRTALAAISFTTNSFHQAPKSQTARAQIARTQMPRTDLTQTI